MKRSRILAKQGAAVAAKISKQEESESSHKRMQASQGSEEVLANSIVAAAAMSKPLSDKYAKIAEELDASKERL